jgi:hypothetical protein
MLLVVKWRKSGQHLV